MGASSLRSCSSLFWASAMRSFSIKVLKPSATAPWMAREDRVAPPTSSTAASVESWPTKLGRKFA